MAEKTFFLEAGEHVAGKAKQRYCSQVRSLQFGRFMLRAYFAKPAATAVLLSFFSFSSFAADFPDECRPYLKALAKEQALQVACDVATVTKQILEEQPGVVPGKLYHFGERKYLQQDAQEGNIPKDVWDKTIMGESGHRFPVEKVRRGLYGTHGIDSNHFFNSEKYDWLMEIRIEDACRKPERVASLTNLPGDPRFKAWLAGKGPAAMSVEAFSEACPAKGNILNVFSSEACADIAEAFLAEAGIKIVQDHFIAKSFYIRDRSCIAGISAAPEDVLKMYADNPAFWIQSCGEGDLETGFRTWKLLYGLLAKEDLGKVDPETLERLLINSRLLDASGSHARPAVTALIESYIQARKLGRLADWQAAVAHLNADSPLLSGVPFDSMRQLLR